MYRQIVGIPVSTDCDLLADLFLFYYEREFMLLLSDNNQACAIEVSKSTLRYLDDLSNINEKGVNKQFLLDTPTQ